MSRTPIIPFRIDLESYFLRKYKKLRVLVPLINLNHGLGFLCFQVMHSICESKPHSMEAVVCGPISLGGHCTGL